MSDLAALIVHLSRLGAAILFEPLPDATLVRVEVPDGQRIRVATRAVGRDLLAGALTDKLLLTLEELTRELGLPLDPERRRPTEVRVHVRHEPDLRIIPVLVERRRPPII